MADNGKMTVANRKSCPQINHRACMHLAASANTWRILGESCTTIHKDFNEAWKVTSRTSLTKNGFPNSARTVLHNANQSVQAPETIIPRFNWS